MMLTRIAVLFSLALATACSAPGITDSHPISRTCGVIGGHELERYREIVEDILGYDTLVGCDLVCGARRASCEATKNGAPESLICNGQDARPITPDLPHAEKVRRAKYICHEL